MITITHTHEGGTLVEGSRKGDGVYDILRGLPHNWRYFPSIRQIGLGQSRDKAAQTWKIDRAAEALRAAGHEVTVEVDDSQRRTFAEAEADRYERAGDRATYHEEAAGNAAGRSDAAYRAEHGILDMIPAGQPILVGHHSERRHRRDLERADSLRRRARAEDERAGYHAGRADAAERFQARRENIPATLRRIKKLEAEERDLQRRIDGRPDWAEDGNGGYKLRLIKPEGEYLARLEGMLGDTREQLAYWREHVKAAEECGVKVWTGADFARGDYVRSRGRWYEVLRVNAKSLSVPWTVEPVAVVSKATARTAIGPSVHTRTLPYDEVTGRKSAGEMAAILAEAGRREAEAS